MTVLDGGRTGDMPTAGAPTFIETQFPVSRLSKESYKERKANYSQTLTGLGKWWGRKPLVMVRAILLGLLMPASSDPRKDREVFLALLTMDEEGLWRRKSRSIPLKEVHRRLSPAERAEWFARDSEPDRPRLRKGAKAADRARLQRIVFDRMGYDDKLRWMSAFPGAPFSRHSRESGNPETPVSRRDAPVPEGLRRDVDAEGPSAVPGAPSPPVPTWVDLDCAITALVEGLEADDQREVAKLRGRDWLAEDRAVEEARRDFETKKGTDAPKGGSAAGRTGIICSPRDSSWSTAHWPSSRRRFGCRSEVSQSISATL